MVHEGAIVKSRIDTHARHCSRPVASDPNDTLNCEEPHYNRHRPHQSRQQRPPDVETQPVRDIADLRSVRRKPVAAGMINEYHHAA